MSTKSRIAKKLVGRVFLSYFFVAVVLTATHIVVHYFGEIDRIDEAMDSYRTTVQSSLVTGLWNYDKEILTSTLSGVIQSPLIFRASAYAKRSPTPLVSVGTDPPSLGDRGPAVFHFDVLRTSSGSTEKIGTTRFYYDGNLALMNTLGELPLIIGLSLVKTLSLWVIIFFWGRNLVEQPLEKLTELCDNTGKSQGDYWSEPRVKTNDEIQTLESAFIRLMERINNLTEEAKARRSFISKISHELRTPLNAIIGYSDLIIEDEADREEQVFSADARVINRSGKHLLHLVNEILDMSRLESKALELQPRPTDPVTIGRFVREIAETSCATNDNRFILEIRPDTPGSFLLDEQRITQIIINLVSNAARFTKEGEVRLLLQVDEVPEDGSRLTIRVSDTGIGIPAADLDRIFDAFEQAHTDRQESVGGVGLGLAITRELVTLMGGTLQVESEENKGSTFTVVIPVQRPAPLAASA